MLEHHVLQKSPNHSEADFVLHHIADESALAALRNLCFESVSERPATERPLFRSVAEGLVEREVGNERCPLLVEGDMGNCSELEDDLRANASHALCTGRRFTGREARTNQIQR